MLQSRIEKLNVEFFELHQNLLQRGIFRNDVEFKTAKLKCYAELGADFSELTQKFKRLLMELGADFFRTDSKNEKKIGGTKRRNLPN